MLIAGLVAAVSFFGTFTGNAAKGDYGTIFEDNGGQLYAFCTEQYCDDGANPVGTIIVGPSVSPSMQPVLYGVTQAGGKNAAGVIWELNPDYNGVYGESVLYNFCNQGSCADGGNPNGDIVQQSDGTYIGMTTTGGAHNWGTLWKFDPSTKIFTVLESCTITGCN